MALNQESSYAWLDRCCSFIARWEGFSPIIYKCPAGIKTFGYGFLAKNYPNQTFPISQPIADEMLKDLIIHEYWPIVQKFVATTINDNQIIALISFCYNLGAANFAKSTLLKKINNNDFVTAANEFDKWVNAKGKPLEGLKKRRKAEKELFLTPINNQHDTKMVAPLIAAAGYSLAKKIFGSAFDKIKKTAQNSIASMVLKKVDQFIGEKPEEETETEEVYDALTPEQLKEIEIEGAKIDAQLALETTKQMLITNETYREELKSENKFIKYARPANAYLLGIAMIMIIVTGTISLFTHNTKEFADFIDALVMPLTAWVGILGVYMNGRSKEKINGVAK